MKNKLHELHTLSNIYEKQQEQMPSELQSSEQLQLETIKLSYSKSKIILTVLLVFITTYSAYIQIDYHGPFVRTVQCFFNYHLLTHQSQDIYEASDVIFYRTQEYQMGDQIRQFFDNYIETIGTFYNDSFFYPQQSGQYPQLSQISTQNFTMMVVYKTQDDELSSRKQQYFHQLSLSATVCELQTYQKNQHTFIFINCPLTSLSSLFNKTVQTKPFYEYIKKIQLITQSIIKYKQNHIKLQIKLINDFQSYLMMMAKVETNVLEVGTRENVLQSNLGIRKRPEHHFLNTDFYYAPWVMVILNAGLFCVELMVILRTNKKIEDNLSPPEQQVNPITNKSVSQFSFFSDDDPQKPVQNLTYQQRIDIIGRYSIAELLISFLFFFCFRNKGLACLLYWTKLSVILSATGNKMMIGFLFKNAIPTFLRIIINLLIPLMGFVFFSMLVYTSTRKFETLRLGFYEYIFNYFQYGIYENFLPISKYGSFYTFTYFLQLFFLVSVGNNILQSILAQQILKNSNLKSLTEFIQNIEVECPICGCPPEVKKKIKIKMKKQNNRQNRFISKYFNRNQKDNIKSKYQIKIASPQFSPMFHKSQLNKKQFHLKKRQFNQPERKFSEDQPANLTPPFSPRTLRKKVKFEIGSEVEMNEKYAKKQVILAKKIIAKTEILNKVFTDFNSAILSSSSVNKYFYDQVLKKKIQDLKKFSASIHSIS